MEPKSTKNHENRWLEALLDHLWHISGSKVVAGSILGRFGEAFWLHFGGYFREKIIVVGVIFSYFFERRFFRILMDLELLFMTFELQNRLRNRKGEKMKNLCFIKGTPMFWRVQASLFWSKSNETRSLNTKGILR